MTVPRDEAGKLPAGVSVGHWTDLAGQTGCTVILAPGGAVGGVDVRGGAPGTLGTDALQPGRVMQEAHAVLLTGGSAFGLAAATGILRYLEERGVGASFGTVTIPIVAGAVIFDLLTGDARARPDAEAGYAACAAATRRPGRGAIGAGTGATVAKAGGGEGMRPGGTSRAHPLRRRHTLLPGHRGRDRVAGRGGGRCGGRGRPCHRNRRPCRSHRLSLKRVQRAGVCRGCHNHHKLLYWLSQPVQTTGGLGRCAGMPGFGRPVLLWRRWRGWARPVRPGPGRLPGRSSGTWW